VAVDLERDLGGRAGGGGVLDEVLHGAEEQKGTRWWQRRVGAGCDRDVPTGGGGAGRVADGRREVALVQRGWAQSHLQRCQPPSSLAHLVDRGRDGRLRLTL